MGKSIKKEESNKKKKEGFKLPHVYIIFMVVMLIVVLLSWIVPSGEFARVQDPNTGAMMVDPNNFTYDVESKPISFLDYFTALHTGVVESAGIIGLLLLASGSIAIVNKSGAMGAGIQALLKVAKGKETLILILLAAVFAVLGTMGLGEGGLPFIPLIVAVTTAMGYDRVTGYAVFGTGMLAGFTTGLVNFYSTGVSQLTVGLPLYSGIGFRAVSLVVFFVITCSYLVRYAKKIKEDPSKSVMADEYIKQLGDKESIDIKTDEDLEFTTRRKIALFGLIFTFFFTAFGALQWGWMMGEMAGGFVVYGVALVFILKLNPDKAALTFGQGAGQILPAGLAIGFARSVMVLMSQAKIVDTAVYGLSNFLVGKSVIVTLLGVFLSIVFFNFFVVSASGKALILMPILGPLAQLLGINQQVMVVLYQFGDGITNQVWPSSGALMAGLAMVAISYKAWIKYVGKLAIILHIVAFGLIYIAHTIGLGPF